MGAGTAKVFQDEFPYLPCEWGARTKLPPCVLVSKTQVCHAYLVGFPTKYDWRKPSPIQLIERSAKQLRIIIEAMGWKKVLLPRPGCDRGGLSWPQVKVVLEKILDDRVTIISKE